MSGKVLTSDGKTCKGDLENAILRGSWNIYQLKISILLCTILHFIWGLGKCWCYSIQIMNGYECNGTDIFMR